MPTVIVMSALQLLTGYVPAVDAAHALDVCAGARS
jgi:hypothetical protein